MTIKDYLFVNLKVKKNINNSNFIFINDNEYYELTNQNLYNIEESVCKKNNFKLKFFLVNLLMTLMTFLCVFGISYAFSNQMLHLDMLDNNALKIYYTITISVSILMTLIFRMSFHNHYRQNRFISYFYLYFFKKELNLFIEQNNVELKNVYETQQ